MTPISGQGPASHHATRPMLTQRCLHTTQPASTHPRFCTDGQAAIVGLDLLSEAHLLMEAGSTQASAAHGTGPITTPRNQPDPELLPGCLLCSAGRCGPGTANAMLATAMVTTGLGCCTGQGRLPIHSLHAPATPVVGAVPCGAQCECLRPFAPARLPLTHHQPHGCCHGL